MADWLGHLYHLSHNSRNVSNHCIALNKLCWQFTPELLIVFICYASVITFQRIIALKGNGKVFAVGNLWRLQKRKGRRSELCVCVMRNCSDARVKGDIQTPMLTTNSQKPWPITWKQGFFCAKLFICISILSAHITPVYTCEQFPGGLSVYIMRKGSSLKCLLLKTSEAFTQAQSWPLTFLLLKQNVFIPSPPPIHVRCSWKVAKTRHLLHEIAWQICIVTRRLLPQ